MKIKVLGCAGAEMPGHNPPGFLLDDTILLDAGSLTNKISLPAQRKIKDIFITHAHLDHIRSIPFLADNLVTNGGLDRINVMSIAPVIRTIKRDLFNSAVWPDFTIIPDPFNAIISLSEIRVGTPVATGRHTITAYKVRHSVPAVGYLAEDRDGASLFYTGDTGPTPGTWKRLGDRRIDCLIIEASFPDSLRDLAIMTGHLTPSLLQLELRTMKRLPGKILITHPKPQYRRKIMAELRALPWKNIRLLREGETIRL